MICSTSENVLHYLEDIAHVAVYESVIHILEAFIETCFKHNAVQLIRFKFQLQYWCPKQLLCRLA